MKKITKGLQTVENAILVVTFITMIVASFAQVVNRNFIGAGISWFEELARYCMVYMALFASEMGLRDGTQISITGVVDKLPKLVKKMIQIIAKLIVVLFSLAVFIGSFDVIKTQLRSGQVSPGLKIPMFLPYAAFPISFGMITVVQVIILVQMIVHLVKDTDMPNGKKSEETTSEENTEEVEKA